ncbi:hypothetical protein MA16_Dca022176 [Dendrobium catenatum]|uniref:Uncharacterized protein n=1 Tax=Dendrobium catenatum TaxID=906689 RepID=A0A2I0VXI7_9ASPA|nr:hypothetical protein MA16_Dca022176 [Dendrobium catenatum]
MSNGKLGSAETHKVYVPVNDKSIENTENNKIEVEPQPISHNLDKIVVESTDGNLETEECLVEPLQNANALVLDEKTDNAVNVNGSISLVEPSIFVSIESMFNEVENVNFPENMVASAVLDKQPILLYNNAGEDCEDEKTLIALRRKISKWFRKKAGWFFSVIFFDMRIVLGLDAIVFNFTNLVSACFSIEFQSFGWLILFVGLFHFAFQELHWEQGTPFLGSFLASLFPPSFLQEDGAERDSSDLPFLGVVHSQPD